MAVMLKCFFADSQHVNLKLVQLTFESDVQRCTAGNADLARCTLLQQLCTASCPAGSSTCVVQFKLCAGRMTQWRR